MPVRIGTLGRHKGTGYWTYRVDGKPVYIPNRNTSEEEANAIYEKARTALLLRDAPTEVKDKAARMSDLAALYLEDNETNCCAKNASDRRRYINLFVAAFGELVPDAIKPAAVEKWIRSQPGWNDTTKSNCCKRISGLWNWLVNNDHVSRNPMKAVKRPVALPRGEEYILSADEFRTLYDAANDHYKPILRLLWETGARPSEILGATAAEYDPSQHAIVKRKHKTAHKGKRRTILLTDVAEGIVRDRLGRAASPLLWTNSQGTAIAVDVVNQYFVRLAERVGIAHPCCLYSLRHSFAVRHLERGIAPHIVAGWLGNTLKVFTEHYAHILERIGNTRSLLV